MFVSVFIRALKAMHWCSNMSDIMTSYQSYEHSALNKQKLICELRGTGYRCISQTALISLLPSENQTCLHFVPHISWAVTSYKEAVGMMTYTIKTSVKPHSSRDNLLSLKITLILTKKECTKCIIILLLQY